VQERKQSSFDFSSIFILLSLHLEINVSEFAIIYYGCGYHMRNGLFTTTLVFIDTVISYTASRAVQLSNVARVEQSV